MKIPELKIGNLTAAVPIIQGGMGIGVSMSSLAFAVARQGGIFYMQGMGQKTWQDTRCCCGLRPRSGWASGLLPW